MPGSREDLAPPGVPSLPPSTLAGIFSKEQRGRCQIQKEFGPNSLEIPAYGFILFIFFFFLPFLSAMRICKVLGCSPLPRGAQPPRTASRRQEFSQEIPLSTPLLLLLLLRASKKLPLEIRSPFKFRFACIILDSDLLIICIWFISKKKLSNADVLISASAWRRNTKFAAFPLSPETMARQKQPGMTIPFAGV